ncbi:hypothetical protein RFI_07171 [Reticulomyxa filosa]|uniref:Uncharacterized protein n=1 Tax=Reticulomyxa filosa TaxID=46433 RepID=X6NUH5_RETFI|nr:hypothetical protein RFI_07171 [Reticulomyxa filosa]|eukprot:ETO29950.1 hypothetical protein RFI_07171 [Reticulomyxa filosa]
MQAKKNDLFSLTQEGVLCVFSISGKYLQKWVNLRFDIGWNVFLQSNYIVVCGAPNKVRIFDCDTLQHLGTLPPPFEVADLPQKRVPTHSGSTKPESKEKGKEEDYDESGCKTNYFVLRDEIELTEDNKKLIALYGNGSMVVWNVYSPCSIANYTLDQNNSKLSEQCAEGCALRFDIFQCLKSYNNEITHSIFTKNTITERGARNVLFYVHKNCTQIKTLEPTYNRCHKSESKGDEFKTCQSPSDAEYFTEDTNKITCFTVSSNGRDIIIAHQNGDIKWFERSITDGALFYKHIHTTQLHTDSGNAQVQWLESSQLQNYVIIALKCGDVLVYLMKNNQLISYDKILHNKETSGYEGNLAKKKKKKKKKDVSLKTCTPLQKNKQKGYNILYQSKLVSLQGLSLHPGGKFLSWFDSNLSQIHVLNLEQHQQNRCYKLPSPPTVVIFDSSGLYMVVACVDCSIYMMDWFSGCILHKGIGQTEQMVSLAFSIDNKYVSSVAKNGVVITWEVPFKLLNAMEQRSQEIINTDSTIQLSFAQLQVQISFCCCMLFLIPFAIFYKIYYKFLCFVIENIQKLQEDLPGGLTLTDLLSPEKEPLIKKIPLDTLVFEIIEREKVEIHDTHNDQDSVVTKEPTQLQVLNTPKQNQMQLRLCFDTSKPLQDFDWAPHLNVPLNCSKINNTTQSAAIVSENCEKALPVEIEQNVRPLTSSSEFVGTPNALVAIPKLETVESNEWCILPTKPNNVLQIENDVFVVNLISEHKQSEKMNKFVQCLNSTLSSFGGICDSLECIFEMMEKEFSNEANSNNQDFHEWLQSDMQKNGGNLQLFQKYIAFRKNSN